ncbi:unnamed protein product [Didymodactylos carnosus]|uniref:Uncharacterized protein n=2 Tax=Didymodactylos carnosus TaxID=1234261 RepID=A0A8S2HX15_9BILA|nr:unnamed protein product [Didymodactylos carnosus]CAF3695233.1 unnamed protein product [Didymodactylos carnosus]
MFDSLLKHLCDQIELLESRTIKLGQKTLDLERYNRSFNLRFYGFEERGTNDNIEKRVSEFLTKNLEIKIHHPVIENCHRAGVKRVGKPRPIIVRFHSRPFRQLILTSLTKLKGQKLGITVLEDLTKQMLNLYYKTRDGLDDTEKHKVVTRQGRVYIRNADKSLTLVKDH